MEKEFNLSEKHEELSKRFYKELKKFGINILSVESLILIVAETWENDKEFIKIILECKCPICNKEEPCKHCSQIEDLNNNKWIKKIKKRAGEKLIC